VNCLEAIVYASYLSKMSARLIFLDNAKSPAVSKCMMKNGSILLLSGARDANKVKNRDHLRKR